jgi:dienelactone hydrolase
MSGTFHTEPVALANGLQGNILTIPSGDPVNFHEALSNPGAVQQRDIFGQLFLPKGDQLAAVIVVPGSLGVADSHLAHCASLSDAGIAALAIDPFGARDVTSTVANQAQYSFAASSWDVLCAAQVLGDHPAIDITRIGAQGHSRGGTAVVNAAVSVFPNSMGIAPLCAAYAAYPWCGFQFTKPDIGNTVVRSIIGDQDEWCLPQQVQGYMHAMTLAGGEASCRIIEGAHHSFDRESGVTLIEDASVAPSAPTTFLTDEGCFIHPISGQLGPDALDRDVMLYGVKSGYGVRGAHIGSSAGQPALFREDMMQFWQQQLA